MTWITEEDAERLYPILEAIHPQKTIDVLRTKIVHLDSDGRMMAASSQDRIFRRSPALRYQHRIHEAICRIEGGTLSCADAGDTLTILHSGYAGAEKRRQKGKRNARILREELEQNPYDGISWVYLGDAYKSMGEREQAWDCYRRVLEDPKMDLSHEAAALRAGLELLNLMLSRPAEEIRSACQDVYTRLQELGESDHPDPDYFLGSMYLKAGELGNAAVWYERALEKLDHYRGPEVTHIISDLEQVNRIIATAAFLEKDWQRVVTFSVAALKVDRYSADSVQLLLSAFLTEWTQEMPIEPYWEFLCRLYDMQNLKDLLFLYKFTGIIGFTDLQARVLTELPPEARE